MKKIRYYLEYIIIIVLMAIVANIPYVWALKLGGFITRMAWILGIRKNIARKNFEVVFGDKYSKEERDKILKNSYINFGMSMAEFVMVKRLSKSCLLKIVNFDDAEILKQYRDTKQGALLVTGHLGSWEMLGASLAANKMPIDFLVGKQSNSRVDELVNETRRAMMIGIIHMGVAARGVMKSLRDGRMVAMLSDQDAGRAGVECKMFGLDVMTPGGPAAFALKTKVPIVCGIIVRNEDKLTHRLIAHKLELPELTGNHKEDILIVTQAYTNVVAQYIRDYPEMWFWVHRRFKRVIEY